MRLNGVELRPDFGDPAAEAKACRNYCALFDFSFISTARLGGKGARQAVEKFARRSLGSLAAGKIAYAVRADEDGHARSDLTIWKNGDDSFDVMSGRAEDVGALVSAAGADLRVEDVSAGNVTLALQGPSSLDALRAAGAPPEIGELRYFSFAGCDVAGIPCRVGRLGYTGEAGFEIIAAPHDAAKLRKHLAEYARPAGFIAADALRIEAGFVLFANEFRLPVSPREAGLGKFFDTGSEATPELKLVTFHAGSGALRPLPWFSAVDPSRPRRPGEIAVTSACRGISRSGIVGLGYVRSETPQAMPLQDPGGVFCDILQMPMPIYDPHKLRPRLEWHPCAMNSHGQT